MGLTLNLDYLLVLPVETPIDPRGLIDPFGTHRDSPKQGTVVAAGKGYWHQSGQFITNDIGVDSVVVLPFGNLQDFRWDGATYKLVLARDVLGVVT